MSFRGTMDNLFEVHLWKGCAVLCCALTISLGEAETRINFPHDDLIVKQPWSGSFLPSKLGGAAAPQFPRAPISGWIDQLFFDRNLKLGLERVNLGLPHPILLEKRQRDTLRPSEKYDLIVGSEDWNTTRQIWAAVAEIKAKAGKVAGWAGSCNGWAIASFLFERPTEAKTINDVTLSVYDQKSLMSHFATTSLIQDMVTIVDTNPGPGAFHRTALEKLRDGQNFVIDMTDNGRVNNKPVFGMNSVYTRLKGDAVRVDTTIRYVNETSSQEQSTFDSPAFDDVRFVDYSYVIRVTESGEIKDGGYWIGKKPDFLWFTPKGVMPWSTQDYGLPEWEDEIPTEYFDAAKRAASFRYKRNDGTSDAMPQLLGKVIYKILGSSNTKGN